MESEVASPLGLCVLPEPAPNCARTVSYPQAMRAELAHLGIPYTEADHAGLSRLLGSISVLLTVGDAPIAAASEELLRWVESGGVWVSLGGVCGLPEMFGVEVERPAFGSWGGGVGTLGEGYLAPAGEHVLTGHLRIPLHFFNGIPVRPREGARVLATALDAHQHGSSGRAALVEAVHGGGRCLLIAPDLTGAVVRIRQGIAVTRDGVPAPDGTAPICDEVLKSGDGGVLDWVFDRVPVPDAPGLRAFLEPIADQWAELIARAVLWGASHAGARLPLLWLYPRERPAMAVLSHDSDGNDPAKADVMLRVLSETGVRSTWCLMTPGYPGSVISAVRDAGHELAMHYDAVSDGTAFSPQDFARQHRGVCELIGGRPVTNKNHYLRWEGDTEFHQWCSEHGVRVDQSKGASKTGEAGFNFGTCHLHRPLQRDGRVVDVFEMPTPTQDLVVFAPPALGKALTESVRRAHGILHLLFHPAHIETAGVADAMRAAISGAREAGMEWWTSSEAAAWEEARLACEWDDYRAEPDGVRVTLRCPTGIADATVLWSDPEGPVARWGFKFVSERVTVGAGEARRLSTKAMR